jgi:hypothetical protein
MSKTKIKPNETPCPHCAALLSDEWLQSQGNRINGQIKSVKKSAASRANGRLSKGAPKKGTTKQGEK